MVWTAAASTNASRHYVNVTSTSQRKNASGLRCIAQRRVWEQARQHDSNIKEFHIRDAFSDIDQIWDELFPREQERIVKLLVERVIIGKNGVDVRIRAGGVGSLVNHVRSLKPQKEAV